MKIGVAGKGGTGKTLIAGTLARFFAKSFKVLAIDNDPSMNLIYSLGMDPALRNEITPIAHMTKLVLERTSIEGAGSVIYKANPYVSDIPDTFKIHGPDNLELLVLGTVEQPSSGCLCAPNVLVRSLLSDLILNRDEVVIVDFEAGIEHISRGTGKSIDVMLIVTGAYQKSLDLTEKLSRLSQELGIKKTFLIGNMIENKQSEEFLHNWAEDNSLEIIGIIPRDPDIIRCEQIGESPYDTIRMTSPALNEIKRIFQNLKRYYIDSE
ncbi:MAG: carbon monoxide dehydrogenase [Candidatus Lokiarchaeota archaeon]|nr:carbon monoxide dehydrogenase [Candidatus Lokiarchaeota archaeon]